MAQTEHHESRFADLDCWDDLDILSALAQVQARAIEAVRAALPAIAEAARALAARLDQGGRLVYAGAGTSIRIGVQDGSELPATFGMAEDRLVYLIAGGRDAMFDSAAAAEDDAAAGARAVDDIACVAADAVIAISASGTTPYTVAAARRARERGALVIGMANNPGSPLALAADHGIFLDSGPEAIAGSTRMGAGTAQKSALNLLSTLAHIRLGAVYGGMMVNVRADNAKLKARARSIVAKIAQVDEAAAEAALERAEGSVKPAVLLSAGVHDLAAAQALLQRAHGNLRLALKHLSGA